MLKSAAVFLLAVLLAGAAVIAAPVASIDSPATDLDAFMAKVMARRDDNWKKLQQYILDEHDVIDVRGPGNMPLWGDRRDFMWFVRDGFFIKSPVKVNGVTISESARKKAEDEYLAQLKVREARRGRGQRSGQPPASDASAAPPVDVQGLILQTRNPDFIDSAYFLKFKFESGKYAFVGRETVDGHDALRIEYYPARLFSHEQDQQRRRDNGAAPPAKPGAKANDDKTDVAIEQGMNKVALVTLWVEPTEYQILKYTFDNVDLDFMPGAWLMRFDDLRATMTMGQPFPDVWLPHGIDIGLGMMAAVGHVDIRYKVDFSDYRLAATSSRIKTPEGR